MTEMEKLALSRARLMVSGRYRIPWTYAGETAGALQRRGLIDAGGYLTALGLRSRSVTSPEKERE